MKSLALLARLTLAGAVGALLAGCLFKPTTVKTHSFILTPIPAAEHPGAPAPVAVGIAPVKMPPYLLRSSLVIRKGTNEIDYLENALWAERLDHAFQRTLAANLAILLPSDRIRLSEWRRDQVALAVHVGIEQLDVDIHGTGTLIAWWRITTPAGDKVLATGSSRLHRTGPAPQANPQTVPATLSELTAQLSRELAQAVRQFAPPGSATNQTGFNTAPGRSVPWPPRQRGR